MEARPSRLEATMPCNSLYIHRAAALLLSNWKRPRDWEICRIANLSVSPTARSPDRPSFGVPDVHPGHQLHTLLIPAYLSRVIGTE